MDFQPGDYFSHADLNCIKRKSEGFGILQGCEITPSSNDLSVTIGTGSVVVGYGASSSVVVFSTSNTISLSSNVYYPRKAIIYVTSNGVLTSSLGVAEAAVPPGKIGRQTQYPIAPSIPFDSTQLAEVWIPVGAVTGNDLSIYVSTMPTPNIQIQQITVHDNITMDEEAQLVFSNGTAGLPASYIIFKIGSTYCAKNGKTGAIDYSGTDFVTVMQNACYAVRTGGRVEIAPGTYECATTSGVYLGNQAFTNFAIIGHGEVILKTVLSAPGYPDAVLDLSNSANSKILIQGLTLDMNRGNANILTKTGFGIQWNLRIVGEDITIRDCKIINGCEEGIVFGAMKNFLLDNCVVNNVGEHPFYFSGSPITQGKIHNCRILNWAKYARGYATKTNGMSKITFSECHFEGNEDGLGFGTHELGSGCYNIMTGGTCADIRFENCSFIGQTGLNPGFVCAIDFPENSVNTNITIDHCRFEKVGPVWIAAGQTDSSFCAITNCTFDTIDSWDDIPQTFESNILIDCGYLRIQRAGTKVINNDIVRVAIAVGQPASGLIVAQSAANGTLIKGNRFYNWACPYGFTIANAVDWQILDNWMSGGLSTGWFWGSLGTNTLIRGNIVHDDRTYGSCAIYTYSAQTGVKLIENQFGANATGWMNTVPWWSLTEYYGNHGYSCEGKAKGTATITAGNSSVNFNTGMYPITPNRAKIIPKDNLLGRSFWWDTPTTSTIRVNISSIDTIDHSFEVEVEM